MNELAITNDELTINGHLFSDGQKVRVANTGGALPAGLTGPDASSGVISASMSTSAR